MSELFKPVPWTAQNLVAAVESGALRLPDIQRPFVWDRPKVRDLVDSLYRGFPVGELMFWNLSGDVDTKTIGTGGKTQVAKARIVDGQQRLTSLYVVMTGQPILDDDYKSEQIRIGFNPFTERFEVTSASVENSLEWITDISEVFKAPFPARKAFIENYRKTKDLDEEGEARLEAVFAKLHGLRDFTFTVVELQAEVDREKVAEIFVRINSEGVNLTQADFILTWLSVFWDEGRDELEDFSQNSRLTPEMASMRMGEKVNWTPKNHYVAPSPGQMLRVIVALGQNRGRLRNAYKALRGQDPHTGMVVPENRARELESLQIAQAHALNSTNWDDFLRCLALAGFRSRKMITSQNTIFYTYAIWLIGLTRCKVDRATLRHLMARWFFMSQTTGRYTNSPETRVEEDLRRIEDLGIGDAEGFVAILEQVIATVFTPDYWTIRLPDDFVTSLAALSPAYQGYVASLAILDADLFALQDGKVKDWLDPAAATAKDVETHHLVPRNYLDKTLHITDIKRVNQAANFAPTDWSTNGIISDNPPSVYWPELKTKRAIEGENLRRQQFWHALPDGWETMEYDQFLEARRKLMAKVVQAGFARLSDPGYQPNIDELLAMALDGTNTVEIALQDLLDAGLLKAGDLLTPIDSSSKATAEVTEDATIVIGNRSFDTPGRAARFVDEEQTDGWGYWLVDENNESRTLQSLVDELVSRPGP